MSKFVDFYLIGELVDSHGNVHYEDLKNLPAADVVEVVRCRDCIHCADDWNGNQPMFTCDIAMCHESVEPSDYCFLGERREDEQIL